MTKKQKQALSEYYLNIFRMRNAKFVRSDTAIKEMDTALKVCQNVFALLGIDYKQIELALDK